MRRSLRTSLKNSWRSAKRWVGGFLHVMLLNKKAMLEVPILMLKGSFSFPPPEKHNLHHKCGRPRHNAEPDFDCSGSQFPHLPNEWLQAVVSNQSRGSAGQLPPFSSGGHPHQPYLWLLQCNVRNMAPLVSCFYAVFRNKHWKSAFCMFL